MIYTFPVYISVDADDPASARQKITRALNYEVLIDKKFSFTIGQAVTASTQVEETSEGKEPATTIRNSFGS